PIRPTRRPWPIACCDSTPGDFFPLEERSMSWRAMRGGGVAWWIAGVLLLAGWPAPAPAQPDQRSGVFDAPVDRVWVGARSTLKGLGWGIDKEDREGGWIRTDSRRIEGEDYGVYSKGMRQRVRLVLKVVSPGRTAVTVERRVWKQERILWMDKEEDVPST